MLEEIIIYCDGGCRGNHLNQNVGWRWAVLIYQWQTKEISGSEKNTTNNKMELLACIKALQLIKKFDKSLKIYTDSAYLYNCMTKWRYLNRQKNGRKNSNGKPVENRNMREELLNLLKPFPKKQFFKVQAHSGDKYNELADGLVNKAMDGI